jgi:hypothetical protein
MELLEVGCACNDLFVCFESPLDVTLEVGNLLRHGITIVSCPSAPHRASLNPQGA